MPITAFCPTPALESALAFQGIHDYGLSAYGGESAALDCYLASSEDIILKPGGCMLPTGLRICLPTGTVGLLLERGSVTKTPLMLRAGVIDPGWSGEIFAACWNLSDHDYVLRSYQKLPFQLIVTSAYTNFARIGVREFETLHESSVRRNRCLGDSDALDT
jgi:dUTPase